MQYNANALTRSQPNGQKQIKRVQLHVPFHDGAVSACVKWNNLGRIFTFVSRIIILIRFEH